MNSTTTPAEDQLCTVTVRLQATGLVVRGQGQRPWEAVVDALQHHYPGTGTGVAINWFDETQDKWTASAGEVKVFTAGDYSTMKVVGTWQKVDL